MAALKRIHLFAAHPNTIEMMELANQQIDTKLVEPYYSMALSRLKIISAEEFAMRVNKGF